MNGIHDIGGMHGFGSVPVADDTTFEADWERTVFAMNLLLRNQGIYNLDEFRHATERMNPTSYYGAEYFERWLRSLERLLGEKNVVSERELATFYQSFDGEVPDREDPELRRHARHIFEVDWISELDPQEPRFESGDEVLVRNDHPPGHHRTPRYVRGATGEIRKVNGTFQLADAAADGRDVVEPCYSVKFDANELWNDDTDGDELCIDMWESYLEVP